MLQALGGTDQPLQRYAQLARMLRDRRLALGMSLEALGLRIGVSASTLKQIESGVRAPSRKTLLLLAEGDRAGAKPRGLPVQADRSAGEHRSTVSSRRAMSR
jgi:transcriptional regulator with XRE-family HTH domain